ncbi:asparagine synthase-related protein, partial [Longimycelium tulufanense]|uniref:asparagine synthase-related protein n=1 Tax=Longimycelium tulufanense TaxID=907463 RepID=UPI0027E4AD04
YRDAMHAAGLPAVAMPFLDRPVIEAALAVHPWQRTDPWAPKPLLRAAFAGTIAERLLNRRTKGHYNADILHGWTIHRDQLATLARRSLLAEYGLINPETLHQALTTLGPRGLPPVWLTELYAIERWLRDLTPPFPEAAHHVAHPMATPCTPPADGDQARPRRLDRPSG